MSATILTIFCVVIMMFTANFVVMFTANFVVMFTANFVVMFTTINKGVCIIWVELHLWQARTYNMISTVIIVIKSLSEDGPGDIVQLSLQCC